MYINKKKLKQLTNEQIIDFIESLINDLKNNTKEYENYKKLNNVINNILEDMVTFDCDTTLKTNNDSSSTTPSYTLTYYTFEICHGCKGKGWVNCEGIAQKCPICDGEGKISLKIGNETIETGNMCH